MGIHLVSPCPGVPPIGSAAKVMPCTNFWKRNPKARWRMRRHPPARALSPWVPVMTKMGYVGQELALKSERFQGQELGRIFEYSRIFECQKSQHFSGIDFRQGWSIPICIGISGGVQLLFGPQWSPRPCWSSRDLISWVFSPPLPCF